MIADGDLEPDEDLSSSQELKRLKSVLRNAAIDALARLNKDEE